jgi:hypothetical protein
VNNLLIIIEPDVSRSGKLYTALSRDDTGFLVNLRTGRTGLSKNEERESYDIITVPMQFLFRTCVNTVFFVVVFVATVKKLI